ncbi:MAG TPA: type II CAAX endopeptidase family protein [Patescibacteria group bacterium]|nr:type II CAAX endopeptidase family protein [Patescibacteria group bacterium]
MIDRNPEPDTLNPEPAEPAVVPWRPLLGVVYVIFVFFAAQLVAGILVSIYPWAKHWSNAQATDWLNNSVIAQFLFVLLAEGLTLGSIYAWLRRYKVNFKVIGLLKPRWRDAGYGLLAVVPYYVAYVALVGVVSHFAHGLNVDQQQQIGFTNVHGVAPLVFTFISLAVLPPLTEEIMVRGFLYGSLRKTMRVLGATLLTSAIFASAHLPEGGSGGPLWIAALDTFTLSLVLCYLREKTGSLWASITLHGIKNGIAFLALFILNVH